MKKHRNKIFVSATFVLTVLLVLASAASVLAAKLKLSNGTTFSGKIVSQNDNYVILEIGGTKVSVAKRMIVSAEGLPPGVTITNQGAPAPVPAQAQPKAATQPVPPTQGPAAAETGTSAAQSNLVEITLKNGAKFKGVIVAETENLITLQNESGARVNIYKNIIANIPGRQISAAPVTPEPVAAPAPVQQQTETTTGNPVVPAVTPAAPVPATAPAAAATAPPPQAQQQTSTPAVIQAVPAVTPAAPVPATAPAAAATAPPPQAQQQTPTPAAIPAVPVAPQVAPAPVVAPPPPAAAVPIKRPDGKRELLLKNGTVFIGTIVSENDRFLSFGTSEGTTINILKRLIRKLDGVPYVVQAAASPTDTSSQLKRIAPAAAATGKTPAEKPAEARPAVIKRRVMPNIAIKPGVSMAELIDSLKSTFRDQRAVSARQIGTMGQWATGSIGALTTLLGDTAGAQELPPLETDSASMEKMLSPGFEAARALLRIGPQGIDALKRGALSANALVRVRSVFGLSETQEIGQLPLIKAALKDDDPRVRSIAARSLRFNEAADDLVKALDDRDGDVRTFAASALGDLRSPGAVKALVAALKDVRPSVRVQAALSLAKTGSKEAIAPMAELATDMESQVREKAVMALGMLKDTAAAAPLLTAMADPNPRVRTAAVEALAALYDPRAIPSLYTAMQEKNDTVRAAVETALKQLTEIPLLIAALDNGNSLVRGNVAYILWLMTGTDLGQDRKAWTEWYAGQGKTPKKTPPAKTEEKKKDEKKAEEKKK